MDSLPETPRSYNGWTNYETWNVKLWIDNDESSHRYWRGEAQEAWDGAAADSSFTRDERAALDLADRLKAEHEDGMPESGGTYGDLLRGALSDVNWYEIASSLIEDVDRTAE